jgi:hypothetical protein
MRIGDVVPASVRFPTISNNLNESATERSFSHVGNALAVGFDVQLEFFVLFEEMLFDVFDIDAGVFNGNGVVAAGDFDSQAVGFNRLRGSFRRRRRRILSRDAHRRSNEEDREKTSQLRPKEFHVALDHNLRGKNLRPQVTPLCSKMQMRGGMLLGWRRCENAKRCIRGYNSPRRI